MILIGVALAIHKEGTCCYMQSVNPHPYPTSHTKNLTNEKSRDGEKVNKQNRMPM